MPKGVLCFNIKCYSNMNNKLAFEFWRKNLQSPPLLMELPYHLRGKLVSISSDGRWVTVRTTSGEFSIRKNLSDAVRLAFPEKGIMIHRSHWVALSQIGELRGTTASPQLALKDGSLYPVARGRLDEIERELQAI